MAENDIWEKEEDLRHTRELVDEFEERLGVEVRKQNVELNPRTEEFRRMEFPGKYTVKLLYKWDDKKFEKEYLRKLERNWKR